MFSGFYFFLLPDPLEAAILNGIRRFFAQKNFAEYVSLRNAKINIL